MNFSSCCHTPQTTIPLRRVLAVVRININSYIGHNTDTYIPLIVKAYLWKHWMWAQDSNFPEHDLVEACYLAVNGEKVSIFGVPVAKSKFILLQVSVMLIHSEQVLLSDSMHD
jgi:hypothetical protein